MAEQLGAAGGGGGGGGPGPGLDEEAQGLATDQYVGLSDGEKEKVGYVRK